MSDRTRIARALRTAGRFAYGLREGVRIGLESLRANLFRSALTILGIAIGVMVVVVMAAMVTGIRSTVAEGIEAAGPRNFFVLRFDLSDIQLVQDGTGRPPWWNRPPVTLEEADRVDALPAVRRAVISIGLQDPGAGGGLTLEYDGIRVSGVAGAGETERWVDYRDAVFRSGRNFVSVEVAEARGVVVISRRLAEALFDEQEAVGRRVWASTGSGVRVPLTVVGVFDVPANIFEDQVPHLAVVPHTTLIRRLKGSDEWGQLIVVPQDDVSLDEAEDQVVAALRSARGLAPGEPNNFAVMRSTQLLELFDRFTGVFFAVMIALSSIGLLVGGIGVVGIMMISVTERTREIGVRKSVGASRGEILWQFLVEAGVLTLLGGTAGLLAGGSLAWLVATLTPLPAAIPLWAVAASLAMAGMTGMLFGLIPALRAARMEPVRALRYE
jgi:putative ABC transport system permease protein